MPSFTRKAILLFLSACTLTNSVVQGIPLLGGQFETTTDVQSLLNLALDAAAMKETGSLAAKQEIYQNGVPRTDDSGASTNDVTLQSLSLTAKERMYENPIYNIFRHAFLVLGEYSEGETEGTFDTKPISQYGDTIVNDLFNLNIDDIETEAALVMNVWMVVAHELFEMVGHCKSQTYQSGLGALDRAAALWIGEGQLPGSNDEGHLLYNLAEKAGVRFDQDDGETKVNTEIMSLFRQMQGNLLDESCGTTSGYLAARDDVFNMIKWMTVPLIQNLIHHINNVRNDGGSDFVELYALGTIPRVAACDPAAYDAELNLDVLRELTIEYQDDALQAIKRAYSCFDITCDDIGTYRDEAANECTDRPGTTLAGYSTTRNMARDNSRIDRDILEIEIFLKFEAYGAALDWYEHGWNGVFSLQELAKNLVVPSATNSLFTVFKNFYSQNDDFADNFIMNVLEQVPPYNSASPAQIRELITGTMKYTVMFLSSVSSLQFAVDQCVAQNVDSAQSYWDDGVAFYVGSMEGPDEGGDVFGGEFLFTTSKELCEEFGTCVGRSDSAVNDVVMGGFSDGIAALSTSSCDAARDILDNRILPAMTIPLIQGTVRYASFNENLPIGTKDASLAIGDSFARAVLPLIDEARPASAQTIQTQMQFQLTGQPVAGGFSVVADAFRQAIPEIVSDCTDIGEFIDEPVDGDLCIFPGDGGSPPTGPTPTPPAPEGPPVQAPVTPTGPTEPEDVAFGRYQFTSVHVADGDGSFALDVRDMFNTEDLQAAKNIYTSGANAFTQDLSLETGLVSLSSLSTEAATYMYEDPMFNIFKYALYNDEDLEDTSGEDFVYADDLINEALNNGKDNKLAAEGAVIINVWMVILHRLNQAVVECSRQNSAQAALDSAVALWIGKEQGEGKFDHGWMLYSVGQSAAKFYGLEESEAPVNTELMNLFLQAQENAKSCESDSQVFIRLRTTVLELWRALTKPLILQLLFHMVQSSQNMVELYAVSVIPQCAACDPEALSALRGALFQGYRKEQSLTDELVGHMATFLRCQRMTCEDLKYTSAADSKLVDLVQQICTKLDYYKDAGGHLPMAGYVPQTDVRETARLDLDVLEMEIYTRTKAYKNAMDVYSYGHNSFSDGSTLVLQSLESLTGSADQSLVPQANDYINLLGSPHYADDIIKDILQQENEYVSASRGQRAELVLRALQTMVSFMSVLSNMYAALEHCNDNEIDEAKFAWDKAVALYVGSITGLVAGGRDDGDGKMLYSLANEVCPEFGTCEASGEAETNERILFYFAGGREAVAKGQCEQVTRQIEREIFPRMVMPLVQGTIKFALDYENTSVRDFDAVGTAHMIAVSVIPLINPVNATSASILAEEFGDFETTSPGAADSSVFEAFAYALRGLDISCDDLGTSRTAPDLSLCVPVVSEGNAGGVGTGEQEVAPLPDSPTNLGDDLYVTTTYVQDRANIAIDIKDMQVALEGGASGKEMAELIYKNGQNSEVYDDNGKFVSFRSLKQFSVDSTLEMLEDPLFNIYMYALQESDGTFMSREARLYADSIVTETFQQVSATEKSLPAEAAIALNLWMYVVHLLHKSLDDCKNKEIRDDDGVHAMDVAVAYWIGDGQIAGDAERGHLLYALAEEMGDNFNTAGAVGESKANTNILRLFNEAKNEIALPGACSDNPGTFIRMRHIVNKLVPQMAVPLIQALIHNLRANDRARVKIYATAVVPLFAGCSPNTFSELKNKLIHMNYNVIEVEDIVALLGSAYSCLGLQCDDIGQHSTEQADEAPACDADDILRPLAGYKPASDVREYARLDLDLRHLDILMQMNAYQAATDLYLYGQHVQGINGGSLSLSHLATTSERSVVPSFDAFVRYYDNDAYADNIIRTALAGSDPSFNEAQRRIVVLKSAQVMVMYFGALQSMYEAVSDCSSTASVRSVGRSDSWDRAAAMLIGHLEGPKTNGTLEGYMYYDLAQEHCEEFQTCEDQDAGVAVNDQLVSLLYSGRGAVLGNSCRALRKAADEVAALLLIPQIQGALSSAIKLADASDLDHPLHRAASYVYSRALLPLVDDADRGAATTIDSQLGVPGPDSTRDTAAEVFRSFAQVYPRMNVDCELVGETTGFDACTGVEYDSGLEKSTLWIIISACIGCLCCCGVAIVVRSRKQNAKLPENNPRFIESHGEFNNHSMDLLEKAFSNHVGPRTPTSPDTAETVGLTEDMHVDASPSDDDDFEEVTALKSRMGSSPDII